MRDQDLIGEIGQARSPAHSPLSRLLGRYDREIGKWIRASRSHFRQAQSALDAVIAKCEQEKRELPRMKQEFELQLAALETTAVPAHDENCTLARMADETGARFGTPGISRRIHIEHFESDRQGRRHTLNDAIARTEAALKRAEATAAAGEKLRAAVQEFLGRQDNSDALLHLAQLAGDDRHPVRRFIQHVAEALTAEARLPPEVRTACDALLALDPVINAFKQSLTAHDVPAIKGVLEKARPFLAKVAELIPQF